MRYDRQTMLPEMGKEGQEKLRKASVLLVGVGGLGSPIALYLTAAGIGTLGIMDSDIVSLTNLQRQVLYTESELDKVKTECAHKRLSAINSEVNILSYPYKLTKENADEIISKYDLVVGVCHGLPIWPNRSKNPLLYHGGRLRYRQYGRMEPNADVAVGHWGCHFGGGFVARGWCD